MAHVGKDPLTWSFVKLFARQITQELVEFEGIPGSHAWKWLHGGIWRARLFTKAQVVGVLVSIQERAERVEFLVDDGTTLVKAVRWSSSPWDKSVALGDLVHIEGKLNMAKNWNDGVAPDREIRVMRISRVEDPNEELLHWVDVMELSRAVYSANPTVITTSSIATIENQQTSSASPTSVPYQNRPRQQSNMWDQIAADAFFQLSINSEAKARFLNRARSDVHDTLLAETLEGLLDEQKKHRVEKKNKTGEVCSDNDDCVSRKSSDADKGVRVAFIDLLEKLVHRGKSPLTEDARAKLIWELRKTFAVLRSSGLLFLEDTESDRHVLLSFEFTLKPALLRLLQEHASGMSVAELTEWVVKQRKFQRLPLEWIEISLRRLLRDKQITQREDSQRFHLAE